MVEPRTARGRDRLASAVLVVLITASFIQAPPVEVGAARSKPASTTFTCISCCGASCQCAGDCCGDSHVETTTAPPQWSAAEMVSRDRNCQKNGWLLPTVTTNSQPWSDSPRSHQPTPALHLLRQTANVVCRWQRPAVSQSKPRAPPLGSLSPIDRFIG